MSSADSGCLQVELLVADKDAVMAGWPADDAGQESGGLHVGPHCSPDSDKTVVK